MKRNIKKQKLPIIVSIFTLFIIILTGCNPDANTNDVKSKITTQQALTLTGVGASSQKSAVDSWISVFQEKNLDSIVQYSPEGSGAGKVAFIDNASHFAGIDTMMNSEELEKAKQRCNNEDVLNIPVYISPIVITFNVNDIKDLNFDSIILSKIFSGKIKKWNDPAIVAINPNVVLPNLNITPIHRGDESGTTENFTDYLHKTAGEYWPYPASQSWPKEYDGESVQKAAGVITLSENTKGSITYADKSGVGNKLGKGRIKVGKTFVEASDENTIRSLDNTMKDKNSLVIEIDRNSNALNTYPLVLISYHTVCSTYPNEKTANLIKAWESYVVSEDGQQFAKRTAGSTPLSKQLQEKAKKAIQKITYSSQK